jgi:hypothetical protein
MLLPPNAWRDGATIIIVYVGIYRITTYTYSKNPAIMQGENRRSFPKNARLTSVNS